MHIRDNPSIKWPDKIRASPEKRSCNKYCQFHWDHGHDTNECFDLKEQIDALI